MPSGGIFLDVPGLEAGGAVTAEMFPHLAFAVRRLVQEAHERWLDYANGGILPSGQVIANRTGEYARSIQTRATGDFSGEVYSDLAYAKVIEEGAPQRDMKRMLDTSLKVRLTKDGRRYLIIPFRHSVPGSVMGNNMPVDVHNWWAEPGRQSSHITGMGTRVSGTGAYDRHTRKLITVPTRTYSWGTRIKKADLKDMGFNPRDRVAKNLAGMVRFQKPGGVGGGSHTQYITFRRMVEGSKGWIAPAQPGRWPARTVQEQIGALAEQVFARAVEEDIKAMLASSGSE